MVGTTGCHRRGRGTQRKDSGADIDAVGKLLLAFVSARQEKQDGFEPDPAKCVRC